MYLYFQNNFVDQVMFKNNRKQLDESVNDHAKGENHTPCELEVIMKKEAHEIITRFYDSSDGARNLAALLKRAKSKSSEHLLEFTMFH